MNPFGAVPRAGAVALTAVLLAILVGCGGGGDGGAGNGDGTTPPPSGNPNPNPPPTTSRLVLTGMVTDAPIANAVVTATVSGQTFTANADANGNYTLEITLPQNATDGFVTLSAKGVGSQSYVEFTSLLGTFSSLLTQAGSDATLSSTENFATQITNVSTALAVLLREANSGQPVSSETLIQTLSASLNSQDVLDVATAIKLLVDDAEDHPMPDGQASLSSLLSNTVAREELIDAAYLQDRATFVATQNAIVSDATVVKFVTPASVPSNLIATSLPKDLPNTYVGVDRAIAYTFNADGTGTATASYWHRNMTWSVTNGSIAISFAPVPMWGVERGVCPDVPGFGYGVQELTVEYTIRGATLRQLSDRILAVTENREITYRDCGPTGVTEPVTVVRTILDASNTQSIDAVELRGSTRTLWVYDALSDFENETTTLKVLPDIADLHADGTGTTRVFNQQFSWVVDANSKVVTATFSDGTVAKYRWLREVENVATDVLYDFALPTGERNVGAGVSIHTDPQYPLTFTPNNVVGRRYWLGIGEEGSPPQDKGFRYRLNADGTGSQEDEIVDESGNFSVLDVTQAGDFGLNWGLFWHIDGGNLVQQRTRRAPGDYYCSLVDPTCVLFNERRHFPLASDGARTYSLVLNRTDGNGVNDLSSRQTYIGMFDYEPFGESAPSDKPTLAGKSSMRGGSVISSNLKAPTGLGLVHPTRP
jgi:hypothetical protein